MPKRKDKKDKDYRLKNIGMLFQKKRLSISNVSRQAFIEDRSEMLFGGKEWISLRYLVNVENGNNLPSLEMLIKLSIALETNPGDLMEEIYDIWRGIK